MPHPRMIIIADETVIGDNVHVGQGVTIGGNFKRTVLRNGAAQKLPVIGDRVMISAGAIVGGPVAVGDDVIIGANAVVTKDVPSNSICYGHGDLSKKKIKVLPTGGEYHVLGEDGAAGALAVEEAGHR